MTEMNFDNYSQVEEYFNTRLIDIVEAKGAKTIIWQDPIDNGVTVSMKHTCTFSASNIVETHKNVSTASPTN